MQIKYRQYDYRQLRRLFQYVPIQLMYSVQESHGVSILLELTEGENKPEKRF